MGQSGSTNARIVNSREQMHISNEENLASIAKSLRTLSSSVSRHIKSMDERLESLDSRFEELVALKRDEIAARELANAEGNEDEPLNQTKSLGKMVGQFFRLFIRNLHNLKDKAADIEDNILF